MPITSPASEVQNSFGTRRDAAAVVELTDDEAALVEAAEIPLEHRHGVADNL